MNEEAAPLGRAHAAAALLSRFRVVDLTAFGASTDEIEDLLGDSMPASGAESRGWWTIAPAVRAEVIRRLAGEGRLSETLREVGSGIAGATGDVLWNALAKLDRLGSGGLDTMSTAELAILAPLLAALGDGIPPFPDRSDLERALAFRRLVEPLEQLVGTHFRGRAGELQVLRSYVGVPEPKGFMEALTRAIGRSLPSTKRPFLIYGVGGAGKSTLVAKFILDHARAAAVQRFPFAYLDYDRRTLVAGPPESILIETVRQIGAQDPQARETADRLCSSWSALLKERTGHGMEHIRREFVSFIEVLRLDPEVPLLLVLDTFEEVQYRSAVYVHEVGRLLARLQQDIPRLRTVIVSRAHVPEIEMDGMLALGDLDGGAAAGFLMSQGIADPDIAAAIVRHLGGNPLTLRLAAALVRAGDSDMIFEPMARPVVRPLARTALPPQQVQSVLFTRILEHVHDPEVRKLAVPALILRRITPDVIREVLAEPAGLSVTDQETAERLFTELAREVSLVSRAEEKVLIYRPDLRRVMLQPLRESQGRMVGSIHERAVAHYARFDDPVSRAEEIYHRLSLAQPHEEIEPRFTPDAAPFLAGAIDELAPPEQAWLAMRLGIELPRRHS